MRPQEWYPTGGPRNHPSTPPARRSGVGVDDLNGAGQRAQFPGLIALDRQASGTDIIVTSLYRDDKGTFYLQGTVEPGKDRNHLHQISDVKAIQLFQRLVQIVSLEDAFR